MINRVNIVFSFFYIIENELNEDKQSGLFQEIECCFWRVCFKLTHHQVVLGQVVSGHIPAWGVPRLSGKSASQGHQQDMVFFWPL